MAAVGFMFVCTFVGFVPGFFVGVFVGIGIGIGVGVMLGKFSTACVIIDWSPFATIIGNLVTSPGK